jgi:ribonuclease D
MRFPLPEASIMLRFLQHNHRVHAQRATITQKTGDDKHKKTRQNPELTINNQGFKRRIIIALMTSQSEISIALAAADQPNMVESAVQLNDALEQWLDCEVIGIDTEFVRERTWRADLGLVQLSDGKTVWLVDPLKTGPIHALAKLFENHSIVKVLHAPSEDLDVLLYTTGAVPDPLFDTQIACAMLGQSLQMGYHKTVEWMLDIIIDKGETRSNWCKRPLRPAQLHYAALDVCLLPMMYRKLLSQLKDLGRNDWLAEDSRRLLVKAQTPAIPEHSWKRVGGNGKLDGVSLAILQSLATWRDKEAERRNLARNFVIRDNALMTIANQKPESLDELSALDIWHPNAIRRHGPAVLGLIDKVLQEGLVAQPPETLKPEHRKVINDMRRVVLGVATKLSVDPALLASRRELESLVLTPQGEPVPERFMGWRKNLITEELLALQNAKT